MQGSKTHALIFLQSEMMFFSPQISCEVTIKHLVKNSRQFTDMYDAATKLLIALLSNVQDDSIFKRFDLSHLRGLCHVRCLALPFGQGANCFGTLLHGRARHDLWEILAA